MTTVRRGAASVFCRAWIVDPPRGAPEGSPTAAPPPALRIGRLEWEYSASGWGGMHLPPDRPYETQHLARDRRHDDLQRLAHGEAAGAGAEPHLRLPGDLARALRRGVHPSLL